MKKNLNNKGFTLVEMTLVIAIICMFAGVALYASAKAMNDYKLRTQIQLQESGGFEQGAFQALSRLHDDPTETLTNEAIAQRLSGDALTSYIGNVENYNSLQSNSNAKEAALVSAIGQKLGLNSDEFFCQVDHNTSDNTKQLYIYIGNINDVTSAQTVNVAIISYTQQHGDYMWSATGDVVFQQVNRNNVNRGYEVAGSATNVVYQDIPGVTDQAQNFSPSNGAGAAPATQTTTAATTQATTAATTQATTVATTQATTAATTTTQATTAATTTTEATTVATQATTTTTTTAATTTGAVADPVRTHVNRNKPHLSISESQPIQSVTIRSTAGVRLTGINDGSNNGRYSVTTNSDGTITVTFTATGWSTPGNSLNLNWIQWEGNYNNVQLEYSVTYAN